jgi:hypothetical protein
MKSKSKDWFVRARAGFCAAGLVALLGGAPAHAVIVDYTWTGDVTGAAGNVDGGGIFGAAGASLAGDPFTATIEFDLSKGIFEDHGSGSSITSVGSSTTPLVSSSLTINGHSVSMFGGTSAQANFEADAIFTVALQSGPGDPVNGSISMYANQFGGFAFPIGNLDSVGSYSGVDVCCETFVLSEGGNFVINGAHGTTSAALSGENLTISNAPAVPLPSAVWLLLSGVGVGAGLFRRQRSGNPA